MATDDLVTEFQAALMTEVRGLLDEGVKVNDVAIALMCETGMLLLKEFGFQQALALMAAYANGVADRMLDTAAEEQRLRMH